MLTWGSEPRSGPSRAPRRRMPHPDLRPTRAEGMAGAQEGPEGIRVRRPRRAGPPLPVQGLHTGLPGAGGRGPRDPRGSPAPSRPRARTPGALAARRRRRLPVHGAPRPPPPPPRGNRDQDQRSAGMSRRAPEALTAACRLRRSPPLAVTWRPCVTHKSVRAGVGVGGFQGGARRWLLGGQASGSPSHPPTPTYAPARETGTGGRGWSNLDATQAIWDRSLQTAPNVICSVNYQIDY